MIANHMPSNIKYKVILVLVVAFIAIILPFYIGLILNNFFLEVIFFSLSSAIFIIVISTAYMFVPQFDFWLVKKMVVLRKKKIACLTFDDGPEDKFTDKILSILNDKKIKATFFILGEKAQTNLNLLKKIHEAGHDIGNHGFAHKKSTELTEGKLTIDITKTSLEIEKATGKLPNIYRAPHGFKNLILRKTLKRLGLKLIPWNKGIWDTDGSNKKVLFERFRKGFSHFEILLLHDGLDSKLDTDRTATCEVLKEIIDEYRMRGYEFKKVSEVL